MAFLTVLITFAAFFMRVNAVNDSFDEYYSYLWGDDHFMINPEGTEVQLKLDNNSGAGFRSKSQYGYGWFPIRMKIPDKKTGGIVTSFFLTSLSDNQEAYSNHFELDFEFFGTDGTVQTNVFMNDTGHREQAFKLWFDPSQDFHTYGILWTPKLILFTVDSIPLRVYYHTLILSYPVVPMHIEASIWDPPPEWGWPGPVNWDNGPFIAHYSGFSLDACPTPDEKIHLQCYEGSYFWNDPSYNPLDDMGWKTMDEYRKKYMVLDYCSNNSTRKIECSVNENKHW